MAVSVSFVLSLTPLLRQCTLDLWVEHCQVRTLGKFVHSAAAGLLRPPSPRMLRNIDAIILVTKYGPITKLDRVRDLPTEHTSRLDLLHVFKPSFVSRSVPCVGQRGSRKLPCPAGQRFWSHQTSSSAVFVLVGLSAQEETWRSQSECLRNTSFS